MFDDADPRMLNREAARAAVAPTAELTRRCLRLLVSQGTRLVVHGMTSTSPDEERQAVYGLVRHGLAMADGLDELAATGASAPCIPIVRSLFEGWLQLKYMLQPDDAAGKRQRALAWVVAPEAQRYDALDRFDPKTSAGQELLAKIAAERPVRPIVMPDAAFVARTKTALERFFASPHIAPIHAEYVRTKGNKRTPPSWYALYDGPRTLRTLAQRVGLTATFDQLYGHYSEIGHAKDPHQLFALHDGQPVLRPIREPGEVAEVSASGIGYLIALLQLAAGHTSDEALQGFAVFYKNEVSPSFRELWKLS